VKPRARHGLRSEPARQSKAGSAKSRMSRTNSFLFQGTFPLRTSINHKRQAATMPFRGAENADLSARRGMLASLRQACDTAAQQEQINIQRERMMLALTRRLVVSAAFATAAALTTSAQAEKKYDTGATDTEIKMGNIMPYSGPASSYGVIGLTEKAYFDMINAEGGINGRKIKFITYDDGYSPPKAIEQARKLVESDEVLFIFQSLGTPSNTAIQKYMNAKKVPQLFVATGATKWGDPKNFPWTIGWQPNYQSEGRIYGKYILEHFPDAKIAVFWQNDDAGKDQVKGLRDGLGDKADKMIIADKSYEVSDPSIDSQIVALRDSGADTFFSWAAPKGSAQAIRKVGEIGWKPRFFLANVSTSVAGVLKPAGFENARGIISSAYLKDPTDPAWKDDAGIKAWRAFMDKYYPEGDKLNSNNVYGYAVAQTMVQVLKQCGDNLTRENIMKQAANLKDFSSDVMLPGIKINTSPDDFFPIEQMQLMKFDGEAWHLFGDVITGEVGHDTTH
jgi:ABC-type branched-subunit amino acid transport system substrate-binding protein